MEEDKKILSTEEANNDITEREPVDSLDALLFDADEDLDAEPEENAEDFEAFMAEYRDLIKRNLSESKAAEETAQIQDEEPSEEEAKKEYEEEYLKIAPKKQTPKKNAKKQEAIAEENTDSDWDEDITLAPQEYEDLTDGDEELLDIIENESIADFDLGEGEENDKFQLSISFNESNKPETPVVVEEEKPFKYDPENPRAIDWVFDLAEMFVFVLAAVLLLTTFVFKHSLVEGASMNNTLSDGDHLIISDLFYTPERGDIVVFEDYSTSLKKAVIKRVIGLPGETVEVKLNKGGKSVTVYINGEPLKEDYAFYDGHGNLNSCGPVVLGENEIFVMGDNRFNSTDSCDEGVGPINIDSVTGKVLFRFFPFDKFGAVD